MEFSTEEDRIDLEKGILKGVKVLQVGRLAVFKTASGEVKQAMVEPAHIQALMTHAGNRTVPTHWTHDYHGKQDPLSASVGGIKNFRIDSIGNLIGDLHLAPGDTRDKALWNAFNMPESMMISPVYNFSKSDPKCIPTSFDAADLVESGAGTTALFSESSTENNMNEQPFDIKGFIAALKDPEHGAELRAACKAALKESEPDEAEMTDAEASAGVTDADKKPEDEQKPALMRLAIRTGRAAIRVAREGSNETAILEKAKVLIAAESTALLGKTRALLPVASDPNQMPFVALLAKHRATGASPAVAETRAKNDAKPGEFNEWITAGRPMPKIAA